MVARRVGWTAVISCRLWWLVPDQPPEAALGRVARAGGGTARPTPPRAPRPAATGTSH